MAMNRREALCALVAIPTAAGLDVQQVTVEPDLQPGDLVAISFPGHVSQDAAERIKAFAQQNVRDGVKVWVIGDGGTVTVHRGVAKVEPSDA